MNRRIFIWLLGLAFVAACGHPPTSTEDMARIPGGTFDMNLLLSEAAATHGATLAPALVRVEPFWLDRHEVTNADYDRCVTAGPCKRDRLVPAPFAGADQPVILVTWRQAKKYCAFKGKRLPTDSEWEFAARGTERRAYPYGNEFDPDAANISFAAPIGLFRFTAPVGSYEKDVSPFGINDMAGNVQEFVGGAMSVVSSSSDMVDSFQVGGSQEPGPEVEKGRYRIARGGGWYQTPTSSKVSARELLAPYDELSLWVGFRCAASVD